MDKVGIKESKEVLDFVLALGNAAGVSLSDGKIGLEDLSNFFGALTVAGPAFEGIQDVVKEFKDLDKEEAAELVTYVKEKFDIPQDDIEAMVEKGLAAALLIGEIIVGLGKK